jgi:hypothetical protein
MRLLQSVRLLFHRCIANSLSPAAIVFTFILLLGAAQTAYCDTFTINFESLPSLPTQPNNFAAAGQMQTYSQPGIFTISGGVALGNPTFLPAFTANGTVPNLYGTADFGDPSLSSTITLDLPTTAFQFTSVSFLLFNGQDFAERYQLSGMASGLVLDPFLIGPLASATNSGFTTVTITSPVPITRLNITTPSASLNGWDFLVDNIVLTGTAVTAVPEPSSFILLIAPIGGLAFLRYRRLRRPCAGDYGISHPAP